MREVFCAQSVAKIVTHEKISVLSQYSPHTDLSKEAYAKIFANIASKLNFLEPI